MEHRKNTRRNRCHQFATAARLFKKVDFSSSILFLLLPVSCRFLAGFHGKKGPMQSSMEPWKTFNHRYRPFMTVKGRAEY